MSEACVGKWQDQKDGTNGGHDPACTCAKADDTHNDKVLSSQLADHICKTWCEGRILAHGGIQQGILKFVYVLPYRKTTTSIDYIKIVVPNSLQMGSSQILYKWDGAIALDVSVHLWYL